MSQKLYCYSHRDFDKTMEKNNWNDKNIPEDCAFISICCTPDCQDYCGGMFSLIDKHWFKTNHNNVLNVRFDDIDEETIIVEDQIVEGRNYTLKGLTSEQAKQIVTFINDNIDKNFYIHCNAGKSRSKAITQYILDVFKDHDWVTNPLNPCNGVWNHFVYRKLIQET